MNLVSLALNGQADVMAFVVEDGTGKSDATSFGSVAEADAYHAQLGNDAWADTSKASGTIRLRVNPTAGDSVQIGSKTYTFRSSLSSANDVLIGASASATAQNLVDAIGYTGTPGTQYHASTVFNSAVTATVSNSTITVTHATPGGNSLTFVASFTSTNNVISTFSGAKNDREIALMKMTAYLCQRFGRRWVGTRRHETQALDWPRDGAYDEDGFEIEDNIVPTQVKEALFDGALSFLAGDDPFQPLSADDSSAVTSESVSLGPISISTSFQSSKNVTVSLPRTTKLLGALILSGGEVVRG